MNAQLIDKLRKHPFFWVNGAGWIRSADTEPLCIEAADEIERLRGLLIDARDTIRSVRKLTGDTLLDKLERELS